MTSSLMDRKLELWKHRLLDLGKRNRMINYRDAKRSTLKLTEPSCNELFQRIALNEESLTFQRTVDPDRDPQVYSMLSLLDSLSAPLTVKIGDIGTDQSPSEQLKTLKNMRASARLAQEEQGTNILYLSFGFLEWKEEDRASAPWIRSPLVMVPAVLSLPNLHAPFTLSKHEDDIVVNPTLDYYMKSNVGITLPSFDEDKETLEEYFTKVEEFAREHGWRVVREVGLALLSFLKITMYNDLVQNEERIRQNPVIRAMCGDSDDVNELPAIDENFSPDCINTADCYQVMSADSSQQDAIYYSKQNVSFVMQGPPGTGKSQTITNIISEALAEGKKVLFVSEKMAALQVVYRRLQDAHLADFCLPLHSYRANKKEILEQIGANLKLKPFALKESAMNQLTELANRRQELNEYAQALHQPIAPLNLSCYEVFGKLEELKDAPYVNFTLADLSSLTQTKLQTLRSLLRAYQIAATPLCGMILDNPWKGFSARSTGMEYTDQLNETLADAVVFLTFCRDKAKELPECTALCDQLSLESFSEFTTQLTRLSKLPSLPEHWTDEFDLAAAMDCARTGQSLYEHLLSDSKQITALFTDSIQTFDRNEWLRGTQNAANELIADTVATPNEAEHYFAHCDELIAAHVDLCAELDALVNINQWINQLLGTEYRATAESRTSLSKLHALMQTGAAMPSVWFSTNIRKITPLLKEAKQMTEELEEQKQAILENWESAVLTWEYAPVFQRYKTEYTGFFKAFNRQYHTDQKIIRGFSKNVLKKLPDETAVALMQQLQVYHEKEDWFVQHSSELTEYLEAGYNGAYTEWDTLLSALKIADQIKHIFHSKVPVALQSILATDYYDQTARLGTLLCDYNQSLAKAEALITQNDLNVDLSADAEYTASTLRVRLDDLEGLKRQIDRIAPYLKQSNVIYRTVRDGLRRLDEYNRTNEEISRQADLFRTTLGNFYQEEATDWASLVDLLNELTKLRASAFYPLLSPLVFSSPERKSELSALAAQLDSRRQSEAERLSWLSDQFDGQAPLFAMPLNALHQKLSGCLMQFDSLDKWVDYRDAKEDCVKEGLGDFLEKAEAAELLEPIGECFLAGTYRMWLEYAFQNADALRRFRRGTQEKRISEFSELDDLQLLIAQCRIRQKLIADFPSVHRLVKATDEVAILNKELGKKRNIMPLRKLFRQIPNLLLRLKPCLMMSPLSVSYFLETEAYHFDLVIFDEASQIFPEDAIGAIFRGAQVVIAGDSKQLPPTNFFSTATSNTDDNFDFDEDEDTDEIVSDSILEESASVLPNRILLWHYRSRHESLIAFSNREIYQNNLITFPDQVMNLPDMGVEYVYVSDGIYEGGGKNRNLKEAEKCVELVETHIQTHPKRSLGIIAFSKKQQATIEDAIWAFRQASPQYEWFFDETKEEPFFVKNLENVQGDERDTIIFSICYAMEKPGQTKMKMQFGPLGQDGGERRLNVAITRAKYNVKLVGSIHASDLDLSRTNSEGVRMLRSYIEFASRKTLTATSFGAQATPDSNDLFCDMMEQFLVQNGYQVQKHVGCSDYKVDLAVVDPTDPDHFLAGIECDGPSYIQGKTARDRDHLRKTVMENRGWQLYRVWSTEWNRNPVEEGEALLAFLRSLTEGESSAIAEPEAHAEPELDELIGEVAKPREKVKKDNPFNFEYYKEADWTAAKHSRSKDQLTLMGETILHILRTEQPMHLELLYKRIAPSAGGKVTEALKGRIDLAISKKLSTKAAVDEDRFVRLLPETPVTVRIPRAGDTPRPMEYISTPEVAAAMLRIATHSIGITEDDLTLACARLFGFERKGPRIKVKTDAALRYLEEQGSIRIIDGKVQLIGDAS